MLCDTNYYRATCSDTSSRDTRSEGVSGAESPVSQQQGSAVGAGAAAPLGSNTKSVDQRGRESWRKAQRLLDFSHQRTAARLLPDERVCGCRWAVISRQHGVEVALTTYEDGTTRAGYGGLQVCGSVWLCPCCGKRISEVRRGELNALLAWARSVGLVPVMLTLTARHRRGNDLGQQLAGMKKAKRLMRQRREWRAIKSSIVGTVTATEVTHGGAGWHTHFHEIALIRAADETDALRMFSGMAQVWRACLRGQGMDATLARGLTVQGGAAAGSYVGKWGAAEEVALGGQKQGRGGRTPRQLLAAAHDGDEDAGHLWRQFGRAFKGARQLVWSPGLKALAGVAQVDDGEAAEDAPEPDRRTVAQIDHDAWRGGAGRIGARARRARILDAAETDGAAGVARVIAEGGADPMPAPDIGPLIEAEERGNLSANEVRRGVPPPGDDIIPPPLYKGGIMWPEGGVEHTRRRTGGDTSVDPTPTIGRPRTALVGPGDETRWGADDPTRIETRSG